jgi:hypothetical protein
VAKQCTNCGQTLPRDNARFCNNCGARTSPDAPASKRPSPASHETASPPSVGRPGDSRPALREQIAYQPPTRPAYRPTSSEPPPWMSQLENRGRTSSDKLKLERAGKSPDVLRSGQSEVSPAGSNVGRTGVAPGEDKRDRREIPSNGKKSDGFEQWPGESKVDRTEEDEQAAPQVDFPIPEPMHRPTPSVRELHVKVWEQEEPLNSPLSDLENELASHGEDAVEDLPTGPLEATPPNLPVQPASTSSPDHDARELSSSGETLVSPREDDVEDLPTRPLAAPPELLIQRASTPPPVRPRQVPQRDDVELVDTLPLLTQKPVSQLSTGIEQQQAWSRQSRVPPADRVASQKPVTAAPSFPQSAQAVRGFSNGPSVSSAPASTQGWSQTQSPPSRSVLPAAHQKSKRNRKPPLLVSPAAHQKSKRNRKPLVFVLVLLCLLLGGGVATWIVLAQPFTIAPITKPWQDYRSTALGVSMAYPTGWNKQEDQKNREVHFYDTSHTVQVNLAVADANGQSADQYLQKQATSMGLTGAKSGAPLTFAGVSWQEVQGSMQQQGATYTGTILVTLHGNTLITLTQLAPQARYADAEQTIFSYMRASFQFLS